jgi:antitoxin component YwqK of YwqJK toxin-antitoxin module
MRLILISFFTIRIATVFCQQTENDRFYYANGVLRRENILRGDSVYTVIQYYPNGSKSDSLNVRGNKFVNLSKQYYVNGNLRWQRMVLHDSVHLVTKYYANGLLSDSATFSGEKLIGLAKRFHENGVIAASVLQLNDSVIVEKSYYKNGILEESAILENLKLIDSSSHYNEKGLLKMKLTYIDGNRHFTFDKFRQNGYLRLSGEVKDNKKFGIFMSYNKRGLLKSRLDYNKGYPVVVKNRFLKGNHLKEMNFYASMEKHRRLAIRDFENRRRTLKTGSLTHLKFKDKDTIYRHCVINGYLHDTVVISKFSYDLSENKQRLKFDSVFFRPILDIREIDFLFNNLDFKGVTVVGLRSGGAVLILEPLLLFPLLIGPEVYSQPLTYIFAGVGFLSFVASIKWDNKLSTKRYQITGN